MIFYHVVIICLLYGVTANKFEIINKEDSISNKHKWAILVAGSEGWFNYRHQADICHAYHVLIKNGIPKKHIITFMVDDIANNLNNPFPGKIYNDPSYVDYYNGVNIDYSGNNVTVSNFIKVLKGDKKLKKAGYKVLESGPNDDVFIYYADHGGDEIVVFPDTELYADILEQTLKYMYKHKMYRKLVFYMEACESGSMFDHHVTKKMNIYASTAANPEESSYGCFCDEKKIDVCLADVYSFAWLSDSDHHDLKKRTIKQQLQKIIKLTNTSHPQEYGDMKILNNKLSDFFGSSRKHFEQNTKKIKIADQVAVPDIYLHSLKKKIANSQNKQHVQLLRKNLRRRLKLREIINETVDIIVDLVHHSNFTKSKVTNDETSTCKETIYKTFFRKCFKIQQCPDVIRRLKDLGKLCKQGYSPNVIKHTIIETCG